MECLRLQESKSLSQATNGERVTGPGNLEAMSPDSNGNTEPPGVWVGVEVAQAHSSPPGWAEALTFACLEEQEKVQTSSLSSRLRHTLGGRQVFINSFIQTFKELLLSLGHEGMLCQVALSETQTQQNVIEGARQASAFTDCFFQI